MKEHYIATEYALSSGIGISDKKLPSFDKALVDAGVGNYNLVRLSSILPAHCVEIPIESISEHITEGSLLPTAYSTISSNVLGEHIVSTIGIGFPKDKDKVAIIMELSEVGKSVRKVLNTLDCMIAEAFEIRGWQLDYVSVVWSEVTVEKPYTTYTTFACVSEW